MKIKSLELTHFCHFNKFECSFGNTVTRLYGINGGGKTTIGLTSIWAAIKGISERGGTGSVCGERFRFIADGSKKAEVSIKIYDSKADDEITITNCITKKSNNIKIQSKKGRNLDKTFLDDLFSGIFLSAKSFTALSGKEQAAAIGINTEDIDKQIKEEKEIVSIINSEIKLLGDTEIVKAVEKVDISTLLLKLDTVQRFNADIDKALTQIQIEESKLAAVKEKTNDCHRKITALNKELYDLSKEKNRINDTLEKFKTLKKKIDSSELKEQLNSASQINEQFVRYEAYIKQRNRKEGLMLKKEDKKKQIGILAEERIKYLQQKGLENKEYTIDDEGVLLYKDRPIREPYFSKGELEVILTELFLLNDYALKFRFIDDFDLLDKENESKIIKMLIDKGFQVVISQVNKDATATDLVIEEVAFNELGE